MPRLKLRTNKLLYQIEIQLAILRQLMLELRADLQKAKEATQLAKEAVEVEKQVSYTLGVEETQARLTEELAEVCRDYYNVIQAEAFNLARVPADLEWRQLGKVYYHPKICEISVAFPSPSTTAPKSSEQPLTIQVALPLPEASKGPSQVSDQGQGADGAKDKGKGKETKSSSEAKDAAKVKAKETEAKTKETNPQAKDVAKAKAKEIEAKTKEIDPQAKDAPASQPSQKEDLPKAKKQHLGLILQFLLLFYCFCQCI